MSVMLSVLILIFGVTLILAQHVFLELICSQAYELFPALHHPCPEPQPRLIRQTDIRDRAPSLTLVLHSKHHKVCDKIWVCCMDLESSRGEEWGREGRCDRGNHTRCGVMAYAYSSSTQEAETGGFEHSRPSLKKQKTKKTRTWELVRNVCLMYPKTGVHSSAESELGAALPPLLRCLTFTQALSLS